MICKPKVLLVEHDHHEAEITSAALPHCDIVVATTVAAVKQLLSAGYRFAVAFIDLVGFSNGEGVDALNLIKETPDLKDSPCYVMAGPAETEKALRCLERGAVKVLVKDPTMSSVRDIASILSCPVEA